MRLPKSVTKVSISDTEVFRNVAEVSGPVAEFSKSVEEVSISDTEVSKNVGKSQ